LLTGRGKESQPDGNRQPQGSPLPPSLSSADRVRERCIDLKRGTPRHPKLIDLCELLHIQRPTGVGYLELLWHFTAEFCPQGDIGRYSIKRIEGACHWHGRPGVLIWALYKTNWLDISDPEERRNFGEVLHEVVHRRARLCTDIAQVRTLSVHDWYEHCTDSVRRLHKRESLKSASSAEFVRTAPELESGLPKPKPLPVPKPSDPPNPPVSGPDAGTVPKAPPPPPQGGSGLGLPNGKPPRKPTRQERRVSEFEEFAKKQQEAAHVKPPGRT
jgi:hypothetical protein